MRAEVQLRRRRTLERPETMLRFKHLTLDEENLRAEVNGAPLSLTAREWGILALLLRYPKRSSPVRISLKASGAASIWAMTTPSMSTSATSGPS